MQKCQIAPVPTIRPPDGAPQGVLTKSRSGPSSSLPFLVSVLPDPVALAEAHDAACAVRSSWVSKCLPHDSQRNFFGFGLLDVGISTPIVMENWPASWRLPALVVRIQRSRNLLRNLLKRCSEPPARMRERFGAVAPKPGGDPPSLPIAVRAQGSPSPCRRPPQQPPTVLRTSPSRQPQPSR